MTPLHVAAERAHNDILEVLQKHGAKVCCCVCFLFLSCDLGAHVLTPPALTEGKRRRHARANRSSPSRAGRTHPDLQAAAELRRRPVHRVSAGIHRRSDGQRGGPADSER